jgi:hypothetical protein
MVDSRGSFYRDEEGLDTRASNAQIKAAKPLEDLPLVVISRSPDNINMDDRLPLPAETKAKLRQIWQDLQRELVGWSTDSTHVIADHAGHDIPTEQPELVIDAIGKLVHQVRSLTKETAGTNMTSTAMSADQPEVIDHSPVILGVTERTENRDGSLFIHKDIAFKDPAGDATLLVNKVISYNLQGYHPLASDDVIVATVDEQKRAATVTSSFGCGSRPAALVYEDRVLDQAGNLSEPVMITIRCPATQKDISLWLISGIASGLIALMVTTWLLLIRYVHRHRQDSVTPAIKMKLIEREN